MSKFKWAIRLQLLQIINLFALVSYSQESSATIQSSVENKDYTFMAQSVTPLKGGTRQLNPGYIFKVNGDTLICDLPYFGRTYQPSINATDGGLTFTSIQFDYQTKIRKKDGWDIRIKTKDLTNQRQINLTIYQNGTASMNVTCSDRESIRFYGSLIMK